MKKVLGLALLWLFFGASWAEQSSTPLAERQPLSPPQLIEFTPAGHFSDEYRSAHAALAKAIAVLNSSLLVNGPSVLLSTLRQERLLQLLDELAQQSSKIDPSDPEKDEQLREVVQHLSFLRKLVATSRYVNGNPFEMDVDTRLREYLVRWWEWNGEAFAKEVTKRISFVPRLTATITGTYDPTSGRFGYEITNDIASEGSAAELWIEAVGLTRTRLRLLDGFPSSRDLPMEGYVITISGPGDGYLQDFRFWRFRDNELAPAAPGETFEVPDVLGVPWPSLPGIVTCWVRVAEHRYGVSAHSDPPNIVDLFNEFRLSKGISGQEKKVPMFRYQGKTIGPVPLPEQFDPEAFISRVETYIETSTKWGWLTDARSESLRQRINQIRDDPRRVDSLIDDLAAESAKGQLSPEAQALFLPNLEFFRSQLLKRPTPFQSWFRVKSGRPSDTLSRARQ